MMEEDESMKKIAIFTLLLALACAPSLLLAQTSGTTTGTTATGTTHTPPSPATIAQHRVNYLTTVLSLTPAQQQQATTFFTEAATTASSVFPQIKTARQSLATAIKSNDTGQINQLSSTIGGYVTQLVTAQATAKAQFYQILTADQQSKLTQLESQRQGMGFKGMRGIF
jgi:Spy/CpxP family protein refolding chaperone